MSTEQRRVWLRGVDNDWRLDTDRTRDLPPPPTSKSLPENAVLVDLPEPDLARLGQQPLAQIIAHRRSHRNYTPLPLQLEELGFLLWSAQGISAAEFDDNGEIQQVYRTVPSAGARYPLETYVFAKNVAGLDAGLYRYRSNEHQLVRLQQGDLSTALQAACFASHAAGSAAATFVWTAVPYRTEWKYGAIAHRMIAMEAGHACQNLYLAAGTVGAGVCATLAYDQKQLDGLIGVDGEEEFVLYLATAGKVE